MRKLREVDQKFNLDRTKQWLLGSLRLLRPGHYVRYLVLIFVTIAFGALILSAGSSTMPARILALYDFPNGDKAGHFLLFGLLAFLVNTGLAGRQVSLLNKRYLLGSVILTAIVTVEEFLQLFNEQRNFSFFDLAGAYLGIFIAGAVFSRIMKWSRRF